LLQSYDDRVTVGWNWAGVAKTSHTATSRDAKPVEGSVTLFRAGAPNMQRWKVRSRPRCRLQFSFGLLRTTAFPAPR